MSTLVERECSLVEYLLGGLPPEERAEKEEHLFIDDELNEELQATADDLIHAYLTDTLSQGDRARFEGHFLASPRRRQRLEFMRSLLAAVDRVSVGTSGGRRDTRYVWRRWMLPAAAALIFAAALAVFLKSSQQEGRRAAVSPGPAFSPSLSPRPEETPVPDRSRVSEVSLTRLALGSAKPAGVVVTPGTRLVRLEVAVTEDRPSYDAVLRTAVGTEVWRAEGLVPSKAGEPLAVEVPARILVSGSYTLMIEGETLRGEPRPAPQRVEYPLHVLRER